MTNRDFAAAVIGKRIVAVELREPDENSAELCIERIKLSDGSFIELRGEHGYKSDAVATLTQVAA